MAKVLTAREKALLKYYKFRRDEATKKASTLDKRIQKTKKTYKTDTKRMDAIKKSQEADRIRNKKATERRKEQYKYEQLERSMGIKSKKSKPTIVG